MINLLLCPSRIALQSRAAGAAPPLGLGYAAARAFSFSTRRPSRILRNMSARSVSTLSRWSANCSVPSRLPASCASAASSCSAGQARGEGRGGVRGGVRDGWGGVGRGGGARGVVLLRPRLGVMAAAQHIPQHLERALVLPRVRVTALLLGRRLRRRRRAGQRQAGRGACDGQLLRRRDLVRVRVRG